MINTILFDFDGVLADSEPLHFQAEKKLVEKHGGKFTQKAFNSTLGRSMRDAIGYYKEIFHLKPGIDELIRQHDRIFMELVDSSLVMIPGAAELIEQVNKNGFQFAIASSGTKEYIQKALKKFMLDSKFGNRITSIDMVVHGKPEPDLFLHAAKQLDVPNINCLVIEDSMSGIKAAHSANMKSLFLSTDVTVDPSAYDSIRINSLTDVTIKLLRSL